MKIDMPEADKARFIEATTKAILAFYENEENRKAFEKWKEERNEHNRRKP